MRRIELKEDIEKKERRNKIVIGVILVVLMLFSTAGYAFFNNKETSSSTSEKVSVNGRGFVFNGQYWVTDYNGKQQLFSYLPNETSSVGMQKQILGYMNQPLYFATSGLAESEIELNLNQYASRVQMACMQGENCTEDLPVKNCSSNLITVKGKISEKNQVREEENCVYIYSNDSVRDADAFLYSVFGI